MYLLLLAGTCYCFIPTDGPQEQEVPLYDRSQYKTQRITYRARDGRMIPMTLVSAVESGAWRCIPIYVAVVVLLADMYVVDLSRDTARLIFRFFPLSLNYVYRRSHFRRCFQLWRANVGWHCLALALSDRCFTRRLCRLPTSPSMQRRCFAPPLHCPHYSMGQ